MKNLISRFQQSSLFQERPASVSLGRDTAHRTEAHEEGANRYRTIWISDLHLGTRGCKAEFLLDFLRHNESETLYLVGDIVDAWQLKRSWYWPQSHNDVVQKILRKARKGTKVVYVPGNHDEQFRDFTGLVFGGVDLLAEAIHKTADGRKLLVMHGDQFDSVLLHAKWLTSIGNWAYDLALFVNQWFNFFRRKMGYSYWSLSAYLKHKVKNAMQFVSQYEELVSNAARRRGVDGVVCGHIHKAEMRKFGEILYCNDGDWVESCTALVEHFDGRLEILEWTDNTSPGVKASAEQPAMVQAI